MFENQHTEEKCEQVVRIYTVEGLMSNCTKQSEASSGLWINRLISFLILMLSLTSPLIVVLILLGKLKPENYCEKGEF